MVGLEPAELKEVKLFEFKVTGIWPLDVKAIASDSSWGGCRSDLLMGSAGIWRLILGGID